ncbi:hypothetical protein [Bradyrhizobium sp. Ash2021]|uniref:hypothetical protein n=1 Tax=Bradyrhizobium sp. Ash2021 TaxID=2954771 RepID=UPI00281615EC|nr:hypothetical protein [Bradyrhizobium sp. Ash2021]WMT77085.1 hypothetical protein NL528_12385 [Bradyrhizobium sp. Ash2021]
MQLSSFLHHSMRALSEFFVFLLASADFLAIFHAGFFIFFAPSSSRASIFRASDLPFHDVSREQSC